MIYLPHSWYEPDVEEIELQEEEDYEFIIMQEEEHEEYINNLI